MRQIAWLLRSRASTSAQRPALAHGGTLLSYGELAGRCDRLAAHIDIEPGERVVVIAPNVPALVVGLFAVWHAGGVAVPLSTRLGPFELQRIMADAEPALVIAAGPDRILGGVAMLVSQARSAPAFIVLDPAGEIVSTRNGGTRPDAQATPLGGEIVAILYTSGTTGEAKGVPVGQVRAEAEGQHLAELLGSSANAPAGFAVPISHAFGLACLLGTITAGGLAILTEESTSLRPLAEAMQRHGGRVLHGTPTVFSMLLRADTPLTFESGFTAGSRCPPQVLEALDRRGARILNLYGMTEIGAASACRAGDPAAIRHHTVGRALAGYEFQVVDDEVQVRGPFATSYYRRPWSEADTAGDGWFRTGDLGLLGGDGNLTILGRRKEVIQVGGFNVFAAEVESFLLTHPAIAQVAVVGAPHPVHGEALRALVVPAADARLEPRDVIRFARGGVAGYKVPYDVRIVDRLPLLPSGKPDRRRLAEPVGSEVVRPS